VTQIIGPYLSLFQFFQHSESNRSVFVCMCCSQRRIWIRNDFLLINFLLCQIKDCFKVWHCGGKKRFRLVLIVHQRLIPIGKVSVWMQFVQDPYQNVLETSFKHFCQIFFTNCVDRLLSTLTFPIKINVPLLLNNIKY